MPRINSMDIPLILNNYYLSAQPTINIYLIYFSSVFYYPFTKIFFHYILIFCHFISICTPISYFWLMESLLYCQSLMYSVVLFCYKQVLMFILSLICLLILFSKLIKNLLSLICLFMLISTCLILLFTSFSSHQIPINCSQILLLPIKSHFTSIIYFLHFYLLNL